MSSIPSSNTLPALVAFLTKYFLHLGLVYSPPLFWYKFTLNRVPEEGKTHVNSTLT